jgi:hypothetical protein
MKIINVSCDLYEGEICKTPHILLIILNIIQKEIVFYFFHKDHIQQFIK